MAHNDTRDQTNGSLLSDFWTLEELAAQLNISTRTAARWHSLRIGPPRTTLGKMVLYNKETTRAWLVAQAEAV